MSATGGLDDQDITVRRCTVHVRRRGGWAWGDPEAYLDQVSRAIERALVQSAAEAGIPPGVDAVVTEPVTLHIGPDGVVRVDDTRALAHVVRAAAGGLVDAPATGARPPEPGRTRIEPMFEAGALPVRRSLDGAALDRAALDGAALAATLAAPLAAWSRAGRLGVVVSGWSPAARASWMRALRGAVTAGGGEHLGDRTVSRIAEAVLTPSFAATSTPDVRALALVGAVITAAGGRLPDRDTLDAVLRIAGAGILAEGTAAAPGLASPTTVATDIGAVDPAPSAAAMPSAPAVRDAVRSGPWVVPALPFLVLVQLGRLGYLDGAAAVLAVSGLELPDAALAAMVAGKVLEPPAHGWLRSPAERDAVQLASGLDDEDLRAAVEAWEPQARHALAPLGSALVGLYAADRSRFADVAVTRTPDDGTVVGEPVGGLPIGWTSDPEELVAVLAQLGDPPVLESTVFTGLVERLAPRRALPGTDAEELERLIGAAVGTGLGSLAEDLWGNSADPMVALDRLGDLEARVEVHDRMTIAIPRGQRWLDLKRAGLVDAWPAAWAPGGVWELVTW
ncbi:hypothetical protein [Terrabacter sp. RAF57]|uniref:hypothetical protein n=1 Tax=Terrabacter sp. RAF57 TaxID=3233063 RepID=UPI003F976FBA